MQTKGLRNSCWQKQVLSQIYAPFPICIHTTYIVSLPRKRGNNCIRAYLSSNTNNLLPIWLWLFHLKLLGMDYFGVFKTTSRDWNHFKVFMLDKRYAHILSLSLSLDLRIMVTMIARDVFQYSKLVRMLDLLLVSSKRRLIIPKVNSENVRFITCFQ